MKKKYIFLLVFILFMIVLFSFVSIKSVKKDKNESIFVPHIYNSWIKYNDEYLTTKIIKDYIDPIPNDLVIFREKNAIFCIFQKIKGVNDSDNTFFGKYGCIQYDYFVEGEKIIVIVDGNEINYSFIIDDQYKLKLSNVGDGYEHNYYYNRIDG